MRKLIVVHQGRLLWSLHFLMNIFDSELVHLNQSSSVLAKVAVDEVEVEAIADIVDVDVDDVVLIVLIVLIVLSDITGML